MRVARSALRFPPSARLFSTAGPIIGVDLGTTNSCVAVLEGQTPRVIENSEGQRTTPSCVAFTDKGVLIGTPARRQAVQNSENTFYATKRLIGRKFKDPAVQKDLATSHYKIVAHKSGDAWVEAKGQQYSPSQIGSFVLTKMKETAEAALNTTVRDAVITVPAYFNESQRQATKDAGKIAGLNVHRIINEPTAAALAYGLNKQDGKTIVVYDLGGGTFDVSVLQIERGVFEVKATNGDTMLGGEDFDTLLQNHFVTKFKEQHGIDLSNDRLATHRLREAAEHAKIDLSSSTKTDIDVPYIATGPNGPVHFQYSITRQQHDELVNHLLQRSIAPCDKALKDAGVTKKDIGEVILVGGMTRMPAVQKLVSQLFERPPNKSVNPDEVVASGAAIQGGVLKGDVKDILLIDVTPLSIGFENPDGTFSAVVPRNSPLPVKKSKTISTHHDLQTSMYIHVYQGEREFAADNKYLGLLTLTGIPPSKAGVPKIEIGFNIEAGGVINVSARDKGLNKVVHVTLQPDGGLTEAEVERMVKDAEKFAAADAARKQRVGLMGQARFLLQTAQEALDNNKEQLPAEMVERVTTAIDELQEEIRHDEGEVDPMNKKMETVRQASYALGEYIYKNAKGSADEEKKD